VAEERTVVVGASRDFRYQVKRRSNLLYPRMQIEEDPVGGATLVSALRPS
jgi:hypothetical protein